MIASCKNHKFSVPDITNNDVSYTASGLNPYTHYMVKVVAFNGEGVGHPVSTTVTTAEEGTILQYYNLYFEMFHMHLFH